MKKFLSVCLGGLMALSLAGCVGEPPVPPKELTGELSGSDMQTGFLRTTAEDDFGSAFAATETYNDNYVGIFYFLWLSDAAANANTIEAFSAAGKVENTLTGEDILYAPTFTWWGEPMYGFYQVEDKWVVRKHVELFLNAGLDFICFDTTNSDYYPSAARAVLEVLLEYQKMGYDVPKVMFMTNTSSSDQVASIYNTFYRRDTYDPIWFTAGGEKPWILGTYTGGDPDIENRFYFKKAQWPNASLSENNFPWMSWNYPQETYRDDAHGLKIMNVSVSQHCGLRSGVNFSLSGICAPYNYPTLSASVKNLISEQDAEDLYNRNWGRGYSHQTQRNVFDDAKKNVNFDEQWQSAFEDKDVNLVFVTGWNEWVAQKQVHEPILGDRYGYFVDTFNMEFSRDVEMMNGGYLDNCFISLVRNIRTYKGVGSSSNVQSATEGDLYDLATWNDVVAYADLVKETEARDHAGAGTNYYRNDTGRNDIREVRVAVQGDDLWFLVTTVDAITERAEGDARWMNLWIGLEGADGGYHGLQYVLNRRGDGSETSVDRISGESFEECGACERVILGNHMLFRVPKSVLGIGEGRVGIRFKVTDNLQKDFDVTDLYTNGDCAPIGRINYSYYAK